MKSLGSLTTITAHETKDNLRLSRDLMLFRTILIGQPQVVNWSMVQGCLHISLQQCVILVSWWMTTVLFPSAVARWPISFFSHRGTFRYCVAVKSACLREPVSCQSGPYLRLIGHGNEPGTKIDVFKWHPSMGCQRQIHGEIRKLCHDQDQANWRRTQYGVAPHVKLAMDIDSSGHCSQFSQESNG